MEFSFYCATKYKEMFVAWISWLRDYRSWDPEIHQLFFCVDQMTFFRLIDSHRFRDLPQHRIILKHSCDIHGEACDVTCMKGAMEVYS